MGMNELSQVIREVNIQNGWDVLTPERWSDVEKILSVLALIHSEVSEATEAARGNDFAHFAEELADVVIRTLDCAAGLGIDIDREVVKKVEKNRSRGYRHGGKLI